MYRQSGSTATMSATYNFTYVFMLGSIFNILLIFSIASVTSGLSLPID